MHVKIRPQNLKYSKSCHHYVHYLEKENRDPDVPQQEYFFNQNSEDITPETVIKSIDQNATGIAKKHPKFYLINIRPSDRELQHIQSDKSKLKFYVRELMKDYAQSFNREINGRKINVNDVLYFGKIEIKPKYTYRDKEVKENGPYLREIRRVENKIRKNEQDKDIASLEKKLVSLYEEIPHKINGIPIRKGLDKPGRRSHVHLIVSRKDATNSYGLSPGTIFRASNPILNGKLVKMGFHRNRFFEAAEKRFDHLFNFKRNYADSYLGRKTYLTDPKSFFSKVNSLPEQERKKAYSFLRKTHIPSLDLSGSNIKSALAKIRKVLDMGVEASAVEY